MAEDGWWALTAAARAWPRRFLKLTLATPEVRQNLAVIAALQEIDAPEAHELLVATVRDRRAGRQYDRYFALQSLAYQRDPRLSDLLVELVHDRAQTVRSAALEAALEFGDGRLIPALQRIATAPRTPPGMRDSALDAIEAIALRERITALIPDPADRRLVCVDRPAPGAVTTIGVRVKRWMPVSAGDELLRIRAGGRERRVRAPVSGTIVSVAARAGWEAPARASADPPVRTALTAFRLSRWPAGRN